MNRTILILLGSLVFSTVAHAVPIQPCPNGKTYADYIAVASCLLGDKAFSNFELRLGPNTGAATIPKANQITVTPLNPALNPGLRFIGNPPFQSPPPPGPPNFYSYRFIYNVRVQAGGASITDASLTMANPTVTADGSVTITELICLGAVFESKGVCAGGAPQVTLSVFDMPSDVKLTDSLNFTHPYRLIGTETLLIADLGTKGSASLDSFTEQFSETAMPAPEPGSFVLVAAGLAMIAVARPRAAKAVG